MIVDEWSLCQSDSTLALTPLNSQPLRVGSSSVDHLLLPLFFSLCSAPHPRQAFQ